MTEKTSRLLHELGIYENTQGYYVCAAALTVAVRRPQSLLMATKWLYPEAAKQCGMNWKALEKSLRVTVSKIWTEHPERLQKLSCAPLPGKPTASKFVALLASNFKEETK